MERGQRDKTSYLHRNKDRKCTCLLSRSHVSKDTVKYLVLRETPTSPELRLLGITLQRCLKHWEKVLPGDVPGRKCSSKRRRMIRSETGSTQKNKRSDSETNTFMFLALDGVRRKLLVRTRHGNAMPTCALSPSTTRILACVCAGKVNASTSTAMGRSATVG